MPRIANQVVLPVLGSTQCPKALRAGKPFFLLFTIVVIVLLGNTPALAQNPISIIQADSIVGGTMNGQRVQKILGNVHLKSQNLSLKCDSAYQFVNKNEFRAFGNVEINTEEETIWTDTLIYYTDIDFSQLRGRVIIEADTTTLFGNSVDYRFTTKVAHFIDHIRLEDKRGTLIANSGYYYREADSAVFRGQVQLSDSLQYLEGDSLFSNRKSGYYQIYGDIFAHDRKNETMLKGNYLEADSTGRRLLKGNAWLMSYNSPTEDSVQSNGAQVTAESPVRHVPDTLALGRPPSASQTIATADSAANLPYDNPEPAEADTTHILAEKILSIRHRTETDTTTTIHAYENVRIWSPKFAAVADTARYLSETETFELWSNPKAWHEQVQLTGPYIKVLLQDSEIEQLVSYPSPFAVQQDTSINRLNQIKGDTLQAFFMKGTLQRIVVDGNSHLLRFTKDEAENPDGAIEMRANLTRIMFEDGDLAQLKSFGNPTGSYFPETDQTTERRLDGFSWNPELRPQRPDRKMAPRFPPIPEKRPFKLPPRYLEHIGELQRVPVPLN
jgi:hypothetical protein